MKKILKLSLIVGVLFVLLSISAFAATVNSVSGTDGINRFPSTEAELVSETPLETSITLSGTTDVANVNVSVMIFSDDVPVYVNQVVSKADKSFTLSFPAILEYGRVYEVRINAEGSTSAAKKLYFKAESLKYGDLTNDKKVNTSDLQQLLRYISKQSCTATALAAIEEGKGDVTGDNKTNTSDLTQILRYVSNKNVSNTVKSRLSWYVK